MSKELISENHDFLAIDFQRRALYLDGRRMTFIQDPVFSVLQTLINHGEDRLMPRELDAVAKSERILLFALSSSTAILFNLTPSGCVDETFIKVFAIISS